MWIEQVTTKSGEIRYKYCERYQCPYSGKTKRVSLTYSSNSKQTQKLALIALKLIKQQIRIFTMI